MRKARILTCGFCSPPVARILLSLSQEIDRVGLTQCRGAKPTQPKPKDRWIWPPKDQGWPDLQATQDLCGSEIHPTGHRLATLVTERPDLVVRC